MWSPSPLQSKAASQSVHQQGEREDLKMHLSPPFNFLPFSTAQWISQFPLPRAAELCTCGCSCTYTHHSKEEKNPNQLQSNFQRAHFTHYVLQVSYSWSSAMLILLNKSKISAFFFSSKRVCTKLWQTPSVMDPGTLHKHGWHCRITGQTHTAPKGCIPISTGLVPGSPFCPESCYANPAGWVCTSSGSQRISKTHHRPANNCFSCWVSNPKVRQWKFKKKSLCTDAKQHFSMFSWQELIIVTRKKKKGICLRSD